MKSRERLIIYPLLAVIALAAFLDLRPIQAQEVGKTRFGEALNELDIEGVRQALKAGADPNELYRGRGSAIDRVVNASYYHYKKKEAMSLGEWEGKAIAVLEVLFKAGATLKPHDITILHGPAIRGATLLGKYLLDRGADPNAANWEGSTPVILATENGHPDVVELLIQYGAKPLDPVTIAQIRFIEAARRGDLIAMREEMERGARVNVSSPTKQTALVGALVGAIERGRLRGGNFKVVMELLRLGANPNLPGPFIGLSSPLHVAVFRNERFFEEDNGPAIVEALLKAGAHVSSTDYSKEQTPLHVAASLQNATAVKILLEAGAKVMPRDKDGKTPLDYAKAGPVIQLLKSYGAKESP